MDVRGLLFELFSCVQLPCFIISADCSTIEEEYLPHGVRQSIDPETVLYKARDFKRSAADPQYFELSYQSQSFAAIRLADLRLIMICRPDLFAEEQQRHFSMDAIPNRLQAVNLFLRMLRELCLMSDLPNETYSSRADETDAFLPEEFAGLKSALPAKLQPHNQYRTEVFIQDAVMEGDPDKLRFAFELPAHGTHGVLGPTEARSLRNHFHLVNVLCSRAAIRAGVSPEEAYTLSDKLFMAVELLPDDKITFELRKKAAEAFLQQVRHYKEQQAAPNFNSHVQKTKDYIRRHLFDDISVSDIAEHCSLSTDYLQKIFRQHQGITLSAFVQQEKLKASRELLTDSTLKAAEIAQLLHFSSAPHFNRSFKELFGVTPALYRRQHQKKVHD